MKDDAKKKTTEITTKPVLQFIVLCDGVSRPDQRGKISFIGVFDKFLRPGIIPHFSIAVGWKNGKGNFKFKMKLLTPDLKSLFETPDLNFKLNHETEAVRMNFDIEGINFATPGVYWIEVLLDGDTIQSIPLPVEKGASA